MHERKFRGVSQNPLTELSELRVKVEPCSGDAGLSVSASLKFDSMSLNHRGTEFQVGVSRAFLGMKLSGCEARMGTVFREDPIPSVTQTETFGQTGSSQIGGTASVSTSSNQLDSKIVVDAGLNAEATSKGEHNIVRQQNSTDPAIRSLPNNRWEVRVPTPANNKVWVKGTILSNQELCKVDQLSHGNRIAVIAEVITRKTDLEVDTRANKMMRRLALYNNREAVIGIVVCKALRREVAKEDMQSNEQWISIARCEIEEEY